MGRDISTCTASSSESSDCYLRRTWEQLCRRPEGEATMNHPAQDHPSTGTLEKHLTMQSCRRMANCNGTTSSPSPLPHSLHGQQSSFYSHWESQRPLPMTLHYDSLLYRTILSRQTPPGSHKYRTTSQCSQCGSQELTRFPQLSASTMSSPLK